MWTRSSNRPHPCCSTIVVVLHKEPELTRIALRRFKTELRVGGARDHSSARCTLEQSLLQEIGLDDFLDCVARFAKRRRNGFDSDGPAGKGLGNQAEIAAVEGIETASVHFEARQRG